MPHTDSLTIAQAADLSGRSISSITKLIDAGTLAAEKIGRSYLVRAKHVKKLPPLGTGVGRPRKAKA